MKKINLFVLFNIICVVGTSLVLSGTVILNFDGQPGFNQVMLKWTTQNENNVKGFEVQRSLEKTNLNEFKKVEFVKAKDEIKVKKEYEYKDTSVFKQLDRTYYYRLKIIDEDNSFSFSKIISITPTISSARQTWGSIKAMFR